MASGAGHRRITLKIKRSLLFIHFHRRILMCQRVCRSVSETHVAELNIIIIHCYTLLLLRPTPARKEDDLLLFLYKKHKNSEKVEIVTNIPLLIKYMFLRCKIIIKGNVCWNM
jgi:hypothetical protein